MRIEEVRHDLIGLARFGQVDVVPEGVRQRLKDDKVRIDAGAQKCTMQDRCPAQQRSRPLVTKSVGGIPRRSA